jgi:peptidoglycan hydrolase-like protein with peptidoglycan-binding domain
MANFSMKAAAVAAVIGGAMAGTVSASAALNLAPQSCSYSFNTNMKLGSRGTSVMDLQKVLNMYPQTMVAASGVGSSGMETTYFGNATRAAVNKFQALHLAELGITAPTGNVFAGTRALLNEVCSGSVVSTNPGTTTTYPLGCTSASGFSPITGASCSTGVVTTNPGTTGAVSAALVRRPRSGDEIE